MILKGDTITENDAQNAFFSSFDGKYVIMDNLDEKGDPVIHAREEIYNAEYVYITYVLRGTLSMVVGGTDIEVKANEYLVVMPCMSVVVKESRCIFFTFLTRHHLMADIYKRTHVNPLLHNNAFKFRHIRFTPDQMKTLLECYLRIKREHLHEDYPLKEIVLRSYQSAYIAKFFTFIKEENVINYVKNTNQYNIFNLFLNVLNEQHKRERSVQYYADQLHITPKYLTTVVLKFTRLSASQAIDQYVVFSIKQTLYCNESNIKAISQEYNFPSQSFFGRYFKRITGMSPHEYLKQYNVKSINFVQK
jgi:YesN/AraC family two-component response regulator